MKFKLLFWSVFILNLVVGIILINTLPFKSHGEETGFILSIIVLYLFTYGVFALFTHFVLRRIRREELKQQVTNLKSPIKLVLYIFPFIAFYGVFDILFFALPKAISEENYMGLNGISMALGLFFGGARSIYRIQINRNTKA